MFKEHYSLKVSRRVFDLLSDKVDEMNEDGYKLDCHLETFCNYREQGYMLYVIDDNSDSIKDGVYYLWAFQNRISDEIEIVCGKEREPDNMFTEDDYKFAKCFRYDQINDAVEEFELMLKKNCLKRG